MWKKDMALAYIMKWITSSCEAAVMMFCDFDNVWNNLEKLYHSMSGACFDGKIPGFHDLKMGSKDSINEYSNKMQSLVSELQASGSTISELKTKLALL